MSSTEAPRDPHNTAEAKALPPRAAGAGAGDQDSFGARLAAHVAQVGAMSDAEREAYAARALVFDINRLRATTVLQAPFQESLEAPEREYARRVGPAAALLIGCIDAARGAPRAAGATREEMHARRALWKQWVATALAPLGPQIDAHAWARLAAAVPEARPLAVDAYLVPDCAPPEAVVVLARVAALGYDAAVADARHVAGCLRDLARSAAAAAAASAAEGREALRTVRDPGARATLAAATAKAHAEHLESAADRALALLAAATAEAGTRKP